LGERKRRYKVEAVLEHLRAEVVIRVDCVDDRVDRRSLLGERVKRLHGDADLHHVRLVVLYATERMRSEWVLL